ncbi:hypothetical protein C8034_v004370 [Colletotrichum sidae]|uniref:Uncharacterized protein n=2 Tax=Colletotrichum orbiculare species complex TaxID=2707354 RepID=N4V5K0_COLOR|nr:hypothetical protein Cob_v001559 [Colletotrichum orbiculare MAFF 240422]TEA13769.1 hypothetical protein C8034_v004370 [Colletotrichum sidae]
MKSFSTLTAYVGIATCALSVQAATDVVDEGQPACLIGALKAQGSSAPENYCKNVQHQVIGNLTTLCHGDALELAYSKYSSTCAGLGVQVAPLHTTTVTSTSSVTTTADATSSPTASPTESKPASAAAAIAPHALLFTILGLTTTGLFSIVFL